MSTIREDLLQYIWQTKSFDQNKLYTTSGQSVEILSFGVLNHDSGPDFLNARIIIDGTTWAGHVEIHLKSSDWLRHRHDHQSSYQNVILHVVLEADISIKLSDNSVIPCIELKSLINPMLFGQYQYLHNNQDWVPCAASIEAVPDITKVAAKERALTERLISKSKHLESQLKVLDGDLNELIYQQLSWALGLKVNAEPMSILASLVPYKVIQKHRDQLIQLEAILLGTAGLIDKDLSHPYVSTLLREYKILKAKFKVQEMESVRWKYSKLRPPAFPTIRIMQLAQILHQIPRLEDVFMSNDVDAIMNALNIQLEGYWLDHYRFGVSSRSSKKNLGKNTKAIIIINAIVPLLFMYGTIRNLEIYKDMAVSLLHTIPSELNSITKRWTALSMTNESAADSQGLIELKNSFCNNQLCMKCPIGHKVMSTN